MRRPLVVCHQGLCQPFLHPALPPDLPPRDGGKAQLGLRVCADLGGGEGRKEGSMGEISCCMAYAEGANKAEETRRERGREGGREGTTPTSNAAL